MAKILLVLFTLQLTPAFAYNSQIRNAIANARSRESGMAVAYVAQRAQQRAEAITRPSQLSQDKMDDMEFNSVFISYGAYKFLKPEILGSWEFADRIENMDAWDGYEEVREAAGRARMGTKVKYTPPALPDTIAWLEALAEGAVVKREKIDIDLDDLVKALFKAGLLSVTVRHERGYHQYNSEVDDQVWVEDKFVSTGDLFAGGVVGPFYVPANLNQLVILRDFETRNTPRSRILQQANEEMPNLGIPYDHVTSIKLNSELTARTIKNRLLAALQKNGISMRKLQKAVPRVKGVRPVCESEVE